jgi:hypothetical protein
VSAGAGAVLDGRDIRDDLPVVVLVIAVGIGVMPAGYFIFWG